MGKRSNGEGTIFKRNDGRWCAAYFDEKYRRHYVYGKTQAEVKKKLKMKMENQDNAASENSENVTVEEWVSFYLENYKKNEVKETTFYEYVRLHGKHIKGSDVGKIALSKLKSSQLQKYYNDKKKDGYNPKTIKHIFTLLNSALNKGVELKLVSENVNNTVVLPKCKDYEGKTLSVEEVKKIVLNAKEDELYPIVILTIYTGLRKGEVMALKWSNIDFEKKELYVEGSLCRVVQSIDENGKTHYAYKILEPKTAKSRRVVPLLPLAIEALELQRERQDQIKEQFAEIYSKQDFVFAKCDGRYLDQRGFMDAYHAFLKKYSLTDIRFHDLRHTFATLLLEAGESPKVIQELLGHSTITTTMDTYAHVKKSGKINAIKRLDTLMGQEE